MKKHFLITILILISGICLAQSSKYFGIYSPDGEELLKPNIYSYYYMTGDKLLIIKRNEKYGLVSRKGELLIPCEYKWGQFNELPQFGKWVNKELLRTKNFYDSNNDTICFSRDIFRGCDLSALSVKGNIIEGTYGNKRKVLYHYKEQKVIANHFFAKPLYGKYWAVCPSHSYAQWGVTDDSGNEIIPCKYERIDTFMSGIFKVSVLEKYDLIDTDNKTVIPFVHAKTPYIDSSNYTSVSESRNGYTIARLKGKENSYGITDDKGNVLIDFIYKEINHISDNYYRTCDSLLKWDIWHIGEEGIYALVDKSKAYTRKLPDTHQLNKDSIVFSINIRGRADKRRSKIIDVESLKLLSSLDKMIIVRNKKNKYGVIDFSGRTIIPCKWDYIEFYFDNIAVWKNKKRSLWSYFKKKKVFHYV